MALAFLAPATGASNPASSPVIAAARQELPSSVGVVQTCSSFLATGAFLALSWQRRKRSGSLARAAETSSAKIAKDTLKRLRKRAPNKGAKKDVTRFKMPPSPDPWEYDEEGRRIFPWPKSFAEIVQTSVYATMSLFQEGETRIEVCFPPLPAADLDWNKCDMAETRIVDANIAHCISFARLLIKEPRKLPKIGVEEAKRIAAVGPSEKPEDIETLLQRKFKKKDSTTELGRTVRVLFPTKLDMLRARDIHYDKWKNMKRPELIRRGYYAECDEDTWPGPFEDIFVYVAAQSVEELAKIRNYVEKADAVANRQGRVLRHVVFNCNLMKMKSDIQYFNNLAPIKPGMATQKVHFDFFSTFRNSYFIRFQKYTMATYEPPFVAEFGGAVYHTFPSPWEFFMQDSTEGSYRCIEVQDLRPSNRCMQRKMQRAFGITNPVGGSLPEATTLDDVYVTRDIDTAGEIRRPLGQFLVEGAGEDGNWWEGGDAFTYEISDKWRLA